MDVTFDDEASYDLLYHCEGTYPWYVGSATPFEELSAFDGESTQGTWKLRVTDTGYENWGRLVNWELISTPPLASDCVPCEVETGTALGDAPYVGPTTLAFGPPSPNPFRGTMDMEYSVATSGYARIEVFDVAGRKVRTLLGRYMTSGSHVISWDGTNEAKDHVSAGIYFVRLVSGSNVAIQRVVLLR